jgi:fused signal recognition particle receptor
MDNIIRHISVFLQWYAAELQLPDPLWLPIGGVTLIALLILVLRMLRRRTGRLALPVSASIPHSSTAKPQSADQEEERSHEAGETPKDASVPESVVVPPPSQVEILSEPSRELTERELFSAGLAKTRDSFLGRFLSLVKGRSADDEKLYEDLEELLITSDIGFKTSQKLLTAARDTLKARGSSPTEESLVEILSKEIRDILLDDGAIELPAERTTSGPTVILVVGVNGAGKTTTIGKLAHRFVTNNKKVLLAAADTFRAGAVEQLDVWAGRSGVDLHRSADGAKPSTVAYEAIHKGLDGDYDVVIIDTAGRLHTRVNLMNELGSVVNIIAREQSGAPHETILVVDGTSGQNALEQAREFNAKAKLTGVIITKLDGSPKGGIVIAIKDEIGVPIRYVGLGEKIDALRPFSAEEFTAGLFGG